MIFKKVGKCIFGVAVFSALGFEAQANLISHSEMFSFDEAKIVDRKVDNTAKTYQSTNRVIFFPMFEQSLGILQNVEILFDTDWSFRSLFKAEDPIGNSIGTGGSGISTSDMRVRLVDPKDAQGNNTVERVKQVSRNNCLEYSTTCRDSEILADVFNGSLDWAGGGLTLTDFIGVDELKFSMYRKMTADLKTCGYNDTCSQRNDRNQWSGDITLNYTYSAAIPPSAAGVPEAPTAALIGLALAGIGAGRKRLSNRQ